MNRALIAVLLVAGCTGNAAPHARAERIGSLEDAVGGPHAIGQIGDFLLENDQIRLVISDTGVSTDPAKTTFGRVNTTYGGSLVDADLRRVGGDHAKGNDQLAELLPGFVFTVIDPTDVCIPTRQGVCPTPQQIIAGEPLRDGSDGKPAEVMVTGTGGDLLQMVALLNTGLIFPSSLAFTTVYRLKPGAKYVEIETTIKNTSTGAHPFPFLNPQELKDLGFDVPGVENLQLSVPMGMLPLFGGEQDLFTPGRAGFNVQYAIEDTYKIAGGFPAFPGMVADFLASRGEGVSYGLAVPMSPNNYVNKYASGYPMQDVTPYSMLLPFTYAGVAGVYMYDPPAQLGPGEQFSFTAYFVIGKGDVASVYDTILDLRGEQTGTFGGRVVDELTQAPIARANIYILDANGQPLDQIETDAGGAFLAKLPAGSYRYIVQSDDRLTTPAEAITIQSGQQTGTLVQMQPPATLAVSVIDELGRHAPAKIQLLGHFDPSKTGADPRTFLYDLRFGERRRPTAFDGTNRFIEGAWWTKDGRIDAKVRPGTYDLVVTRGPEYEITTKPITIGAGSFAAEQVTLVPAYKSPGWVAGDFHLHAAPSTDSGLPIDQRVISCAAEGLEVAVATDHNYITDYAPVIQSSGLDPWLLGIPGMELTTFEMGHFNGYPLKIDPGSTRGGEFLWASQPPQKLFDTLRNLGVDPKTSIVQVNHPRQQVLGYFASFFVDSLTAEPYTPTGIIGVFAPYGDEFTADKFSYDFDAIELLTGGRLEDIHTFRAPDPLPPGPFPDPQPVPGQIVVGPDGRPTFPGVVETWFTMLDRGHTATGMGTSDTHHLLGHEPGYARTLLFVGQGKDTPGGYTREDVVRAIREHRAITTNAPYIEMTTADGHMIGDTVKGASVDLTIRVRAPSWAPVDTLVVYSNSTELRRIAIPAGQGTDFETVVQVRPTQDAWVVAEALGSANMFPVVSPTEFPPLDATVIIQALSVGMDLSTLPLASALKPARTHPTTPYAITNPIWIDLAGDGWTPPKPALPRIKAKQGPPPDVRVQFDRLPEVQP
ncbi:MAG TPA: CehA/McbA family metallohydrolase [Kofleriaceae bacterium]|nr:CehA/McbA family metallohydrolase [Kofleriaceae bacterium]